MNYPAILSFVCGFASLSQEILWVRLYSFAKMSTPAAFGFVLMAYLIGIAVGAHLGGRACRVTGSDDKLWHFSIVALITSSIASLGLPAAFAGMSHVGAMNLALALLLIASSASILAFVFPIAHHLGANNAVGQQGKRFALVYTANVGGAALGPLMTGYLLLDRLSLQQSFLVIAAFQAMAAVGFTLFRRVRAPHLSLAATGAIAAGAFLMAAVVLEPHELIHKVSQNGERAKTVIENRHGVITVFSGSLDDDVVYGGNVYDGRTNLDIERNSNGLHRPLLLTALHPAPSRVLMIGLSIGTWLALVNQFPGVEHVDVIEINSGYLQAAEAYELQALALRDPRVHIAVTDARRWLRANSASKYDLVIMNTTWHWRVNSTLLLSAEFLDLVRARMAPGGVLAFNATGSGDAFYTATKVFPHAYRYANFVYAADFDFRGRKDSPAARERYARLQMGGQALFPPGSSSIENFLTRPFVSIDLERAGSDRPFELITDQNMIVEFKYGRALY